MSSLYRLPTSWYLSWYCVEGCRTHSGGRRHHNRQAILVLNLLLGWTILGWVGALTWAITRPPQAIR